MRTTKGFTIIELLVVLFALLIGTIVYISSNAVVGETSRDSHRKTAINAMYYGLEEDFYPKNGYYPRTIDSKTLRTVDPELFTDPSGFKIGNPNSTYSYSGVDCDINNKCKSYDLSAKLEREDTYKKISRKN
jgi:prepilin-type N-terminal cleavage/methylation domain-containing protein